MALVCLGSGKRAIFRGTDTQGAYKGGLGRDVCPLQHAGKHSRIPQGSPRKACDGGELCSVRRCSMTTHWAIRTYRSGIRIAIRLFAGLSMASASARGTAQRMKMHTCRQSLKSGSISPSDALPTPTSRRKRVNVYHNGAVWIFMVTGDEPGCHVVLAYKLGIIGRVSRQAVASWRPTHVHLTSVHVGPLSIQEQKTAE